MLFLPLLIAGSVIFVDASATGANDGSSWADAFTDLQSALALPLDASPEIWIAAGTYRPSQTGDRNASFWIGSRTVYGGFDGTETTLDQRAGLFDQTILDGDLLGDDGPDFANRQDNSCHVVVAANYTRLVTLDGLTIRGGQADRIENPAWLSNSGGGLFVGGFFPFVMRDCRLVDNYAGRWGGGAYFEVYSVKAYPNVDLRRCTFLGNEAGMEGGGAWTGSLLGEVGLDRCRFLGNRSRAGGGFRGGGTFRGCLFSGNRARGGIGGGAIVGGWVTEVTNCTFFGNVATDTTEGGGAIYDNAGFDLYYSPFSNSIFSHNRDDEGEGFLSQIRLAPETHYILLRNSLVPEFHPNAVGEGNLRTDPEFVHPLGPDGVAGTLDDDLRLRVGSPCIDGGDDTLLGKIASVDLAGRDRTVDALSCGDGGIVDIGAYEKQIVQGTTNYCAAAPSSLGVPAVVAGPCAWELDAGDLALSAGPVPQGGGLFFFGPERNEAPLGNGVLCVGGALQRTRFVQPQSGVLPARLDVSDPQLSSLLLPGTCWSFQAWYRDASAGGAGLNLSDAIRVTFR